MGTKLEVYCCSCKEYILEANTDTLKSPLNGDMFKVRPDREWYLYFDGECEDHNLTCPMCSWPFHVEQKLLVRKAPPPGGHALDITAESMIRTVDIKINEKGIVGVMIEGKPKKLVKLFEPLPPPAPEPEPVASVVVESPPAKLKPKKKRGFFRDTRSY